MTSGRHRLRILGALALGGLLLAAGCDEAANMTAQDHLAKAEAYRNQGDAAATAIELKNAVQKDPKNAQARLLLGISHLERGDLKSAEKELLRARDLGIAPTALAEPLGRTLLLLGQHRQVLDEIPVPETASDSLAANILAIRGNAHRALGDLTEAAAQLNQAIARDDGNLLARISLGRLALQQNDLATADKILTEAAARAPGAVEVLALRGEVRFQQRRFPEAETAFQQVVDQAPRNSAARLLLAQAQISNQKVEAAIKHLDQVLETTPEAPAALYFRALAAYQLQDYGTTRNLADQVLSKAPHHAQSQLLSAAANFALGSNEQARYQLQSLLARHPNHGVARRLMGATLVRLGEGAEAVKVLAPLAEAAPDDLQILKLVASAAVQSGDYTVGQRYFEQLAALQPEDAAIRAQLGALRIGAGDLEGGIADLERSLEQNPQLDPALLALAVTHLRNQDFARALNVAQRLRANHPEAPLGATIAGIALAGQNELPQAEQAFQEALTIMPGMPDASANLAMLQLRRGATAEALATLRTSAEHNPANTTTLLRLAQLEAQLGELDSAKGRLTAVLDQQPDNLEARLLLAQFHNATGAPQAALDLLNGQLERQRDNPQFLTVIGQSRLGAGQAADAAVVLRRLIELQPESAQARLLLGSSFLAMNDRPRARQQFEEALRLQPQHHGAKLALTRVLLEQGDAEADRLLAELKKEAADSPHVLGLEGFAAMRAGRFEEAVSAYQRARERQPSSEITIALAAAHQAAGAADSSRATLEGWLAQEPADMAVRTMLANLELERNDLAAAKTHYQKVLETAPNNIVILNNLAWVLLELKEAEAAVPLAERALSLRGKDPRIMDTAGLVYLAVGQTDRAEQLLGGAAREAPDNPEIQYHWARFLALSGKPEEARAILKRVLVTDTPFAEHDKARALLAELGG